MKSEREITMVLKAFEYWRDRFHDMGKLDSEVLELSRREGINDVGFGIDVLEWILGNEEKDSDMMQIMGFIPKKDKTKIDDIVEEEGLPYSFRKLFKEKREA